MYISWTIDCEGQIIKPGGEPDLIYQTFNHDYFCYQNPENKISMNDYLQGLRRQNLKSCMMKSLKI